MALDDSTQRRRRRRGEASGPLGLNSTDPEDESHLGDTAPGPVGIYAHELVLFPPVARLTPRIFHFRGTGQQEAPGPDAPEGPAPTPVPVAARVEKSDWIEIQLLDLNDNPVRNERWEITWPDGSTVSEGKTDRNGVGRIDWIDPSGMCEITFPDLSSEAWERIG